VVVVVVVVDLSNPPLTGEVLVVDVLLVVTLGGLAKATVANKAPAAAPRVSALALLAAAASAAAPAPASASASAAAAALYGAAAASAAPTSTAAAAAVVR
jgi:hypothetical protein